MTPFSPAMLARCHMSLLLPLAWTWASATAPETSTDCKDGSCSADDDAALMQLRLGPVPKAAPTEPLSVGAAPTEPVSVGAPASTCTMPSKSGGFFNTSLTGRACTGNQCCTFYTQTFPCPGATGDNKCVNEKPGQSPEAPVAFPPKADFRRQLSVEETRVLLERNGVTPQDFSIIPNQTSPEWKEAFHPTLPGTEYYNVASSQYASVWGDLGQSYKPFGGISTYIVATVNASESRPQTLFRMNNDNPSNVQHNCGIWWGFMQTYQTSRLEASERVATCWPFNTVTMCKVTKPFVTILGQGNAQGRYNMLSRGCAHLTVACSEDPSAPNCTDAQNLRYKGTNEVAEELLKTDQKPKEDVLQVVVPGCQLAGAECKSCPLGPNPKGIANLVEYFEKSDQAGECTPIPPFDSVALINPTPPPDTLENSHR